MDLLNYRPRSTFDDMRRPTEQEWAKWALMPRLPLWKAVALLCGIEPSSLPVESVWLRAPADSPASDLRHRFELAVKHQHSGLLACRVAQTGFLTDLTVQTMDFAEWAVGVGWNLPAELAAHWRPAVPDEEPAVPALAGWPWGTHETELLRWLRCAAERFWVNYDPSDPTTAVNSDVVEEWLQQQKTASGRPIAKRVAEVMAQMLRPPELPTGPRRKS